MDIREGLLYINDKDVFKTYGAFLTEEKEGDFTNYSALLKPPAMKPHTAVSFREEDGEKLPEILTPAFEPRDVTLFFAILAESKADYLKKYMALVDLLKTGGDGTGWLNIRLPELDKTFRMYYQSCSDYSQLTTLEGGEVAAWFKVKLREPQPTI